MTIDAERAQQLLSDEAFAGWLVERGLVDELEAPALRQRAGDSSLLAYAVCQGLISLSDANEPLANPRQLPCGGCTTTFEVGASLVPFLSGACPRCGGALELPEAGPADGPSPVDESVVTQVLERVGPYRLLRPIGRGGMARVHLAEDEEGNQVALKVLVAGLDATDHARFEQEGDLLLQLDHPNVVGLIARGFDHAGHPWLALELVRGRDLRHVLKNRALTQSEALAILLRCAEALAHAHERGIVHRDIKPGNVMITPEGAVKLADFGIALLEEVGPRLTATNEVVGTPGFVCPEALLPGAVEWTAAADVYSLGALAFRMFANRDVFEAPSTRLILEAHRDLKPIRLDMVQESVPAPVCDLVERMLDKDPAQRPSAAEVADILRPLTSPTAQVASLGVEVTAILSYDDPLRLPALDAELKPGEVIGNLRIEAEVGRGGMGVVYRAHHQRLKKSVALKVLLAGSLASDQDRARFLREAESAAALQHPTIVPIHDAGVLPDGRAYISMELVEGLPLGAWALDRSREEVLDVFARICEGVQHAHARGVIHRDLKPSNILVDDEDRPRILDFGIAKRIEHESSEERIDVTHDGAIMGTMAYMPPEQAGGRVKDIDVRSDVYALGSMLYQCLCGSTPFTGSLREILHQVHFDDPPPPSKRKPGLPWELDAICLKALEKEQDARYQSALELRQDVLRYREGEPILARHTGWAYRLRKWVQRNRVQAALMLLLSCLALAQVAQVLIREEQRRQTILDEVVAGWRHAAVGEFGDATKAFDRAQVSLRADDVLRLPEGAHEYVPPEVLQGLDPKEQERPRVHLDRLAMWIAHVEQRGEAEQARALLGQAEEAMVDGRLQEATESAEKALLLVPEDQVVQMIANRLGLLLVERANQALESARRTAPTALAERAQLLEQARLDVERAQKIAPGASETLDGLVAVHEELGKLAELRRVHDRLQEDLAQAGELVADARTRRSAARAQFLRGDEPGQVREEYLESLRALQQALLVVPDHPAAKAELKDLAGELWAVLVDQGHPELGRFVLQLGGLDPDATRPAEPPRDQHLAVVESGGQAIRQQLGGTAHFKPPRSLDRLREHVRSQGDRFRIDLEVRIRVERGEVHAKVFTTELWVRLVDRAENTISPPVKIELEGGPHERRVAVDSSGRRIIGPFDEASTLDVPKLVARLREVIDDLLKQARKKGKPQ